MKKKMDQQLALPIDEEEFTIHIETVVPASGGSPAAASSQKQDTDEAISPPSAAPQPEDESVSPSVPQNAVRSAQAAAVEEAPAVYDETPDFETGEPEAADITETDTAAELTPQQEDTSAQPAHRPIIRSKPKILLETPYKVSGDKGNRLRYRLEYDVADKNIADESISVLDTEYESSPEIPSSEPTVPLKDINQKKTNVKKEIFDWIKAIGIAIILTVLIRTYGFVIVTVDGPSMENTLVNNERLIVTRYDYYFHDPERFDVIICRFNREGYDDRYVKRVIGLPGETIEIKDGITYINGEAIEEPFLKETQYREYPATVIPEDCYFVMGDNRNDSADSRIVGFIPRNMIIGHARYIVYPFENWRSLKEEEQ